MTPKCSNNFENIIHYPPNTMNHPPPKLHDPRPIIQLLTATFTIHLQASTNEHSYKQFCLCAIDRASSHWLVRPGLCYSTLGYGPSRLSGSVVDSRYATKNQSLPPQKNINNKFEKSKKRGEKETKIVRYSLCE